MDVARQEVGYMPTENAIPLDQLKQVINEISALRLESAIKGITFNNEIYIDSMVVLNILDKLISESEDK